MALIFVLTTVAILTAIGVEFSYNSRVDVEQAVHSRDALRARSLAMSAVNFSRLLLRFQRQIDAAPGGGAGVSALLPLLSGGDPSGVLNAARAAGMSDQQVQGLLAHVLGPPGGTLPPPAGAMPSGGPSFRTWELIPIESNTVQAFLAAFSRGDGAPQEAPRPSDADNEGVPVQVDFGEFSGSFSAAITDEDQKINVQRLAYALGGAPFATFVQLMAMIDDPKYDFIFAGEDRRQRVDRQDVIVHLKDFIDDDEQQSALDPTNIASPFARGFSDENGPYSQYRPRYKAKNARFDTLDELYMVHGIGDAFMSAFGDRLTVYPDANERLNVNTDDPVQMLVNILTAAENPNDPSLHDPLRLQLIMEQIRLVRAYSFIGLSVQQFVGILQANGVRVKPVIAANSAQNVFLGDRSKTFRIVATGEVGKVRKTITAVVRYDDGLGQLLYWKES